MQQRPSGVLFVFALALSLAGVAMGQWTTANVYGAVQDSSGAIVPNVAVTFTNELTGVKHAAVSDAQGEFTATFLPPGTYTLVVEAAGFERIRQTGLELNSGQQIRYPITLEVGATAERGR